MRSLYPNITYYMEKYRIYFRKHFTRSGLIIGFTRTIKMNRINTQIVFSA